MYSVKKDKAVPRELATSEIELLESEFKKAKMEDEIHFFCHYELLDDSIVNHYGRKNAMELPELDKGITFRKLKTLFATEDGTKALEKEPLWVRKSIGENNERFFIQAKRVLVVVEFVILDNNCQELLVSYYERLKKKGASPALIAQCQKKVDGWISLEEARRASKE